MAMEADEDDVWGAVATSPSVSPPAVISTSLSLNTRLQLLAASAGPFLPAVAVGSPFHPGGACYRNVAASPPPSFFSAAAGAPVDRRKKRMIKNRESASRSRARKQAHVTQIETEVMELREANEQLRLKYDQLKATVEVSVPVRKTLQRVLSAPF